MARSPTGRLSFLTKPRMKQNTSSRPLQKRKRKGQALEMLPTIAICPSLCAISTIAFDREKIAAALESVSELSRAVRHPGDIRVFGLDDASEVLASANQFPVTAGISRMLKENGLEEIYSTNDIRLSINTLLQLATPISLLSETGIFDPKRSFPGSRDAGRMAAPFLRAAPFYLVTWQSLFIAINNWINFWLVPARCLSLEALLISQQSWKR